MQGYEADNPNIELLRLRNFTLGKGISDETVMGEQGLEAILDIIGVMVPFVSPPVCVQFVFHPEPAGGPWLSPGMMMLLALGVDRVCR